jgi:hypothetical protein
MLMNPKDKIKGSFIAQMPSEWIGKLPSNSVGHTYRMAMYIWHLKGMKKLKDLVVTMKGRNSFLPIPDWAFPKALDELEKCGMIRTVRQRGKRSTVAVLCDNCYEEYPTLKIQT